MGQPTTRALALLELLQSRGRINGPELARRLAIDIRTLRRYIVMLEEIGIPITAERGRHGAYALVAGFKLPPMMFSNEEALALSVGLLAAQSLGLKANGAAIAGAQAKLERVMPQRLRLRARSDPARGADAALMSLITATQAQTRVHLKYRSALNVDSARDFDPYGLAYRDSAWYVVGMCHLRVALRSFRLDRIQGVAALAVHFTKPGGFDALAELTRSIATLPRAITVEVLLRTDLRTAQAHLFPAIGLFEQVPEGVLLRSSTDDLAWFARQLASVPFGFEIRVPQELRAAIRAHAIRLQAQ